MPEVVMEALFGEFPYIDGIYEVSPPQRFEGGEEAYDEAVGGANRQDLLTSGKGAWSLASHYRRQPIQHWLELGAGGGTCTLGLVAAGLAQTKIITDTSSVFLHMLRRKLERLGIPEDGCVYATLAGEDLGRLAPGSLDAIFIASALHHVSDWQAFLYCAAHALAPGGVLVIQEPFREGQLLMNMAMEVALAAAWRGQLSQSDITKIESCRNSTYVLSDSTLEKRGEDKHNFLVDEMHEAGEKAGFSGVFTHRNASFEFFNGKDAFGQKVSCSLNGYLFSYLKDHHRVSGAGMDVLKRQLAPILQPLDHIFRQGDGPAFLASVVFVK
jgi:ubiquinone/menaquinone biosynthesis C-methylase UbiE